MPISAWWKLRIRKAIKRQKTRRNQTRALLGASRFDVRKECEKGTVSDYISSIPRIRGGRSMQTLNEAKTARENKTTLEGVCQKTIAHTRRATQQTEEVQTLSVEPADVLEKSKFR